ncbi:hypothetical protein [Porticoccus sp.]|uniref:hypothetical protein n=1 Tax=Porticoccus sp. TaxID=2024853 RepID=UPI003F6A49B9
MHHEPKDPRKQLIDELDQLRYTLHESPEVQQNIPMLDEAFGDLEDPFELDIPILTDSLEDEQDPAEVFSAGNNPVIPQISTSLLTEPVGSVSISRDPELEHLLDELVAEYLPILERQLREKLRLALGQDSTEGDENLVDAS